MKRFIGSLALATALTATGALAETTVVEQRAKLDRLWNQETETRTRAETGRGPVATAVRQDFTGASERRNAFSGAWADNWRGGRMHPPAGH